MNNIVYGYTYEYDKEYGGDRTAKNDLTASTIQQIFQNDPNVTFWERTKNGELVPYGDPRANKTDNYDLFVHYFNFWIAIELKSRNKNHIDRFVTATTEGEMVEMIKYNVTKELQKKGYICLWAAVYNDGKIRIWELDYIDFNSLKPETRHCPDSSVSKNPTYIDKLCYLLPANKSIIIDRLNGN